MSEIGNGGRRSRHPFGKVVSVRTLAGPPSPRTPRQVWLRRGLALLLAAFVVWTLTESGTLARAKSEVRQAWRPLYLAYLQRASLVQRLPEAAQGAGKEGLEKAKEAGRLAMSAAACAPSDLLDNGALLDRFDAMDRRAVAAFIDAYGSLETDPALALSSALIPIHDDFERTTETIRTAQSTFFAAVESYNAARTEFPTVIWTYLLRHEEIAGLSPVDAETSN